VYGAGAQLDSLDRVLLVGEAQKALDRACREVGAERLTHHDLRDVFATLCLEKGVDVPTVARWLGHADGGALLMKTYAHLRDAHSLEMAARVTVGGPELRRA
ncbi:MAG: tyrosine-type recombinase/integrase, partial [Opitutaceae bacterium]